jgi:hypothetical protein
MMKLSGSLTMSILLFEDFAISCHIPIVGQEIEVDMFRSFTLNQLR